MEGSRRRQRDGGEPDGAGPRHRESCDGGGQRRRNLAVKSKGEVAALAETINNMTDTLATHPTRSPRSRSRVDQLGGQANVHEGSDRQRQPARGKPDHPGSSHRGGQGNLHPLDPRGDRGSSRTTSMIELAPDDRAQYRAGLAENEPRPLHQHAAGPAQLTTVARCLQSASGRAQTGIYLVDTEDAPVLKLLGGALCQHPNPSPSDHSTVEQLVECASMRGRP